MHEDYDQVPGWPAESTEVYPDPGGPMTFALYIRRRRAQCREAQRVYAKKHGSSDKRKETTKRWQRENIETHRKHQREWARKNRLGSAA